jgi:Flp pilus assembly protein TadD
LVTSGISAFATPRYASVRKAPEAALVDINRALELGVSDPAKAHYNRALAYERMGDLKAAWLDYTKAAELDPEWDAPRTELTRFTVSRK